jgi:sugar phosphate isomerase/epimerase
VIGRRRFLGALAAGALIPPLAACARAAAPAAGAEFRLRYVLSSALYGELPLAEILPEVARAGAEALDLWCRVHGNQREQAAALGDDAFAALLAGQGVRLGVSTRYPLGPFGLQAEMAWLRRFGGEVVVCGSPGAREPSGAEAKAGVAGFLEAMKPHVARAEELGVTIALENHAGQLLCHPDALRHFADANRSPRLGIALAFHHLQRWSGEIPGLIRQLGARNLPFVYFQEHPPGLVGKVAKELELQQLPGFGGGLDYRPLVAALRDIRFAGLVEIFMHPTPRGIPILPTVAEVTAAINRSRAYVEECLRATAG